MGIINVLSVLVNLLIIVISLFCNNIDSFKLLILIQLITNIYFLLYKKQNLLTVGLVFFFLICLFHYGQFVLEDPKIFTLVNDTIHLNGTRFAIMCISMIQIGYFIHIPGKYDSSISTFTLDDPTLAKLREVSYQILLVSIFPLIIIELYKLKYAFNEGYEGLYSITSSSLLLQLCNLLSFFARPAAIILLVSYYKEKKWAKILLIAFISYSFIVMFSGARAASMIYILSIIIIYSKLYVKKIKFSSLLLGMGGCLILIVVLPLIHSLRHTTHFDLETMLFLSDIIAEKEGFLSVVLEEFGSSISSLFYTMDYTTDFAYGTNYLFGLFKISPIIPEFLTPYVIGFTSLLPSKYQNALGGSCIGELWYNFSWFGVFFAYFIGLIVAKIERYTSLICKNNIKTSIFYITLLPYVLLWVRGYFLEMVFIGFWMPFLYKILMKVKIRLYKK